jgi:hypothetical protein
MTIKVQVENPVDARLKLRARKTLDGNILILDHPEIDIVLSPKNKKVLAIAKQQYGDHIYATQSRLFSHLSRKGVVDPSTVHGGNIYGSLEGIILESTEPDKVDSIQMTLYSIVHFLLEEQPHYQAIKKYENDFEKELLEPDEEDSTKLGQVPHKKRKGTMTQYAGINTAYGLYGMYQE